MTVASSAHAALVAIRLGVLSSTGFVDRLLETPDGFRPFLASSVSPASPLTSSGKRAKGTRVPTQTMLTPCSERDDTLPGEPSWTMRSRNYPPAA